MALGVVLLMRGWSAPRPRDWPSLVAIGVLWFGLYNVALNAGERRVDAGTAAMLIQLSPVLVAVLAAVFLKERATPALGVGLLVAFAGVALIATATSGHGDRDPLGVLLCLVSAAAYAVSLILQKPLVSRISAVEVTWIACTVGAVACLPFAGALVRDTAAASPSDIAWVVYLGAFPTAIAFSTYAFALTHMSAGNLSVTTYLVPPITVLIASCSWPRRRRRWRTSAARCAWSAWGWPGAGRGRRVAADGRGSDQSRSSQPRNASRFLVDSPRLRRHSHSLRIELANPSSRMVLNDSSA